MASQEVIKILRSILTLQLASFVLVTFSFYLAISTYPALPHTFPVHFDLSGTPNRWEMKSWIDVLRLPLIQLGAFVFTTALTFWCVYSPRSLAYLNLPKIDNIKMLKLSDEKQGEIRLLSAVFISMITLFISFLFTIINYQLLQAETTGRNGSPIWIVVVIVISLLGSFISVKKLTSAIKHISGQ
ncbi:MAG TPA: DUF1648 domain-containing protein [Methylomusa anaerophila]|uniref:DUF1648 domain-containing protein n=1 Tax=Methylomusa anaerophila TaxID=1930071 RepID=A0A348ALU3_9FIRM|nr:DUF1648 domain-containing protein [Methylomusa anaerophila]BBB92041.1 hypothetical protein MAMMFC1_02726 [Methylomusa anaerophila]HML87947.1 DUF1648 domain-containing protein [Methylomusa anaerophila]